MTNCLIAKRCIHENKSRGEPHHISKRGHTISAEESNIFGKECSDTIEIGPIKTQHYSAYDENTQTRRPAPFDSVPTDQIYPTHYARS
jgi:hypothetical protein